MKKRIALMATALLCALAICLSVIPALTIFAEGAEPENVALGKTVTVNNGNSHEAYSADGWGLQALTDGAENYGGWLGKYYEAPCTSEDTPTILTVDLDGTYELSSVVVKPYDGPAFSAYIMPLAYTVEVYDVATEEWVEVGEETQCVANNSTNPNFNGERTPELVYELDETIAASKVRMVITQDSICDIGGASMLTVIGEIEAYGVAAAAETEPESELTNVALNAYVWQNDANNIADNERFALDFLVDGDSVTAWHGDYNNGAGATPRAPTILTIEMGSVCEISAINVYSYAGEVYATPALPDGVPVLPQAFTLEVFSVEENDWVEVGSYELDTWNIEVPDPDELNFEFDPVEATQVRVVITQNGGYAVLANAVTLIGEVEVMGTVAGEIPPAETETQAPAVTETQAPTVTETEAPEETVVETVVESAEESAEESDTTVETVVDETVADTGVEETVADTTAATDAPATADEGCASVVGFGAVAVLAAAAAAVVLKKKD